MRTAIPVLALILSSPAFAQEPPAKSTGNDRPSEFEIVFTDTSKVRVALLDPEVTIATRYGKLTVPVAEVRRIEPGFRYPEGIETRVEDAIARLASPSFRDREAAEKTLLGFKELAVPALRRTVKGSDPEQVRRAESVLAQLIATLPEDRVAVKDMDTLRTAEFTVRGRLEQPTIRVRSRQFGDATLRLDQLKSVKALFVGNVNTEFTLEAAKYARPGWATWLDTGVEVSPEARLEIVVVGMIDQWSQTPGQYMAGPNGTQAVAPGAPAVVPAKGGAAPPGPPGGGKQWQSGSVIGKVGAAGVPFLVGANYREAKAPARGRLYLIIAPSNWNNDSTGSYKVRVRVGE
jgi:hypothetical protein